MGDIPIFNRRILFVGSKQSGKTQLARAFTGKSFSDSHEETVLKHYGTNKIVRNVNVHYNVWDTSGGERYRRLRQRSYIDTDVFVLCFSLVDRRSFQEVRDKWYSESRRQCLWARVIIVGCKLDLRSEPTIIEKLMGKNDSPVQNLEGVGMAADLDNSIYLECSAKTGEGMEEVINAVGQLAMMHTRRRRGFRCTIF